MKKLCSVLCALCLCLLVGCGAMEKASTLQDYEIGDDSVVAVTGLVGKRTVTGVSTSASNGGNTKEYTYESSSAQDDVLAYVNELLYEQGYIATEDADLESASGTVNLAAKSPSDSSKIITVDIDYSASGYTVTLTRLTGTLTEYEEE